MVSTKYLKIICTALIIIGFLAATFVSVNNRIKAERSFKTVSIVVDYDEVQNLAALSGESIDNILSKMKNAGATHVALMEDTPNNLILSGLAYYDTSVNPPVLKFINKDTADNFKRMVGDRVPSLQLSDIGIGLDSNKIATIKRNDLKVLPRLSSRVISSSKADIYFKLDNLKKQLNDEKTIVIFDGPAVIGNSELIDVTATALKNDNITYGSVEFAKQRGDSELSKELNGHIVRVHSISVDEMGGMPNKKAIDRFALAIKDRNIRVLFIHLPPRTSDDLVASNVEYISYVADMAKKSGFVLGEATPINMNPSGQRVYFLVFTAVFAAIILWFLMILPDIFSKDKIILSSFTLAFFTIISFFLSTVCTHPKVIAIINLLCAISFTLIALTYAYKKLQNVDNSRKIYHIIGYLFCAATITIIGSVLIAANMSHSLYLNKVFQFTGIKASLMVPLLVFAVIVITDGIANINESYTDFCQRVYTNAQDFLNKPIFIWGGVLAFILFIGVALMVMRSGNDNALTVSDTELRFRALLEKVMYARPRTKEFLIGFPAFILAFVAAKKGYKAAAKWLIIIGGIGIVDLLNTFCHSHTPFLVSLFRSINSLVVGIIISLIIYVIWLFIENKNQKKVKVICK